MGDWVEFEYMNRRVERRYRYQVIGRIINPIDATCIMQSRELERLQEKGRINVNYSTVRFELNPRINRQLEDFQKIMDENLSSIEAQAITFLTCVLDDEELTLALEPLEKGNRLMGVLYPLVLALSLLIVAGVSILLMMIRRKEMAILRALGTSRKQCAMMLLGGQVLLTFLGILSGIVITEILVPWLGAATRMTQSKAIICCLLGVLIGGGIGSWSLVTGKTLELLQVKE